MKFKIVDSMPGINKVEDEITRDAKYAWKQLKMMPRGKFLVVAGPKKKRLALAFRIYWKARKTHTKVSIKNPTSTCSYIRLK